MYVAETCILVLYYIQKKNTIIKRKNGMDFLPNSNKEKLKVLLIIVVLFIVDCSSSIVMIYITGIEILSFCNMILKRNSITRSYYIKYISRKEIKIKSECSPHIFQCLTDHIIKIQCKCHKQKTGIWRLNNKGHDSPDLSMQNKVWRKT